MSLSSTVKANTGGSFCNPTGQGVGQFSRRVIAVDKCSERRSIFVGWSKVEVVQVTSWTPSPPQRAVTDHLSRVSTTGAYTVGGIFLSTGRRFTSLIWSCIHWNINWKALYNRHPTWIPWHTKKDSISLALLSTQAQNHNFWGCISFHRIDLMKFFHQCTVQWKMLVEVKHWEFFLTVSINLILAAAFWTEASDCLLLL